MPLLPTGARRLALLLVPALLVALLQGGGALRPQSPVVIGGAAPQPVPAAGAAAVSPRIAPRVPGAAPAGSVAPAPRAPVPADRRPPAASRARSLEARAPAVRTLQERGAAALRSLDYDWRALGYAVRFEPGTAGRLGRIQRSQRLITVYVRRGQSDLSLRTSLAHELGHALDFEHGTTARRERYRELRRLSRRAPWFPCSGCDDLSSPAGDFAEVFAAWLAGPGDFRSRLQRPPDARQLRALTPLFALPRRAAEPARAAPPAPTPSPSSGTTTGTPVLPPLLGPTPTPTPAMQSPRAARARSGDDARRP